MLNIWHACVLIKNKYDENQEISATALKIDRSVLQ